MYIKNDIEWDIKMFLSKISANYSKIYNSLNELIICFEEIKEKEEKPIEGEVISDIELSQKLAEQLQRLIENSKNEVFYNSIFLIVTSFIEFSLTEFCNVIVPYSKYPSKPYSKYNENGLLKSKVFLIENFDINISNHQNWDTFINNAKIRNKILHNGGNIIIDYDKPVREQKDFKEINRNTNIDITETGYMYLNNFNYIQNSLRLEIEFISEVIEEVKQKINSNN